MPIISVQILPAIASCYTEAERDTIGLGRAGGGGGARLVLFCDTASRENDDYTWNQCCWRGYEKATDL